MKRHIVLSIIGVTTIILSIILILLFIYISVNAFEHKISPANYDLQLPIYNRFYSVPMYTYSNLIFKYDERQKNKIKIKRFNVMPFERDDVISQSQLMSIRKCIKKGNCKRIDDTSWGKAITTFRENSFQIGNITIVYGLLIDDYDDTVHTDIFVLNENAFVIIEDPVYSYTNQKYLDTLSKNFTQKSETEIMEELQMEIKNKTSKSVKEDLRALSEVAHSIELIPQKQTWQKKE